MKKIISLILCIVMSFSLTIVANAKFGDILPDAPYEKEIEVIEGLGLMNGVSDSQFNPKGYISRAEFVKILTPFTGVSDINTIGARSIFTDVPPNSEYAREITLAYDLGLVGGDGSGAFNPDRFVSYGEAVKMIIHISGHEDEAKSYGGYPAGYMYTASVYNITKKL